MADAFDETNGTAGDFYPTQVMGLAALTSTRQRDGKGIRVQVALVSQTDPG